jgi:hypothetical protein
VQLCGFGVVSGVFLANITRLTPVNYEPGSVYLDRHASHPAIVGSEGYSVAPETTQMGAVLTEETTIQFKLVVEPDPASD